MSGIVSAFVGGGVVKSYVVVAGIQTAFPPGGERDSCGFISGTIGSITPAIFGPTGSSILQLYDTVINGVPSTLYFVISGSYPQNSFTSLSVGSSTFTSASASYSSGSSTTWSWATSTNFFPVAGNSYNVTFI